MAIVLLIFVVVLIAASSALVIDRVRKTRHTYRFVEQSLASARTALADNNFDDALRHIIEATVQIQASEIVNSELVSDVATLRQEVVRQEAECHVLNTDLFARALSDQRSGRSDFAIVELEMLLEMSPRNSAGLVMLASMLINRHNLTLRRPPSRKYLSIRQLIFFR